ncbi:hypothetical protein ACFLQ5_01950 [Bacteroidota bacterium]
MTKNTIIDFKFSPLYSYNKLGSSELEEEMNKGGVYIWGLSYKKNKNGQPIGKPFNNANPFDNEKHMFIPYYVGQSATNLLKCFKDRHDNHLLNNLYLLLSYDYIKKFYKDDYFPESIGIGPNKERNWFKEKSDHFKNNILYYNNYDILKQLYDLQENNFSKQASYPVECFKYILKNAGKYEEAEILQRYIDSFFKKMFFCYANFNQEPSDFLTYADFESYIFYLLKGKTISKHLKLETVIKKFDSANTKVTINDDPLNIFKSTISRCFSGY